jgi:hypothetical protein
MARHRPADGGRQDILEFDSADGAAPVLRLVMQRPGREALAGQAFFVELARAAAETGWAILRAAQPALMATKLGEFEVAQLSLARGEAAAADCLGFRLDNASRALRIVGFACGSSAGLGARTQTVSALGCLINRLDLAQGSEDNDLASFFAAHEAIRVPGCSYPSALRGARSFRSDGLPRAARQRKITKR